MLFFQCNWNTIGHSVCNEIHQIFQWGSIDVEICSTLLVLIPKVEKLKTFAHFRPISLCTTMYKIVNKVIANRFKWVMSFLTCPMHATIVPRCQIMNNIIITLRIYSFHAAYERKERFMVVKVDLEKAYEC